MKKIFGMLLVTGALFGQQIEYSVSGGMNKERFKKFYNRYHLDTFIEAGTYMGTTTAISSPYFKNVYSIELSKDLYEAALRRLRFYKNIHLLCGYSEIEMEKVLREHGAASTMVFLDAHYSAGNTVKAQNDPPVSEELLLLSEYAEDDTVIILDDVRCFRSNFTDVVHDYYPYLRDLKEYVETNYKEGYRFCIIGDQALIYNPGFYQDKISAGVELFTAMYLEKDLGEFIALVKTIPSVFSKEEKQAVINMANARVPSAMLSLAAAFIQKDKGSSDANKYLINALQLGLKESVYKAVEEYIL